MAMAKYLLNHKSCFSNHQIPLLVKTMLSSPRFFLLRFHAAEETKDDRIGRGLVFGGLGFNTPGAYHGNKMEQVIAYHSVSQPR